MHSETHMRLYGNDTFADSETHKFQNFEFRNIDFRLEQPLGPLETKTHISKFEI